MQRTSEMKRFLLVRTEDESGVSGTGIVAEGVILTNGSAVLGWLTEFDSIGIYPSVEELERIHGHGGRTTIQYVTDATCHLCGNLPIKPCCAHHIPGLAQALRGV